MNELYNNSLYVKATATPLDMPEKNFEREYEYVQEQFQTLKYNMRSNWPYITELIVKLILRYNYFKAIRDDKSEELWLYEEGIYKPNGKSYIDAFCRNLLKLDYNINFVNAVSNKIKAQSYIEMEDFFNRQNKFPHLLPLQNGVLNIYTKEIHEYNPDSFFFTKLPMEYNPDSKCPKTLKFIKSLVNKEIDYLTIQELFGFCLLKEYKLEKGFMFYGEHGRNGKSKLLTLLENFLTPANCSAISLKDIEKDQFALISLQNKLVNIASEISNEAINNVGNYKKIVGRDPISANRKNRSRIEFVNYAKMIFAANELPPVYTLSNSFWLRWVVIEFPFQFLPQNELDYLTEAEKQRTFLQDPDIIQNLDSIEEKEGLLIWALNGLDRLLKNKKFSNETSASHIQKYWLRKSNSVAAFIEDCITSDYDATITKADFRKHYHNYCKKFNIPQLSDNVIKVTLSKTHGVTDRQIRETGLRVWAGVRLKNSVEQQQDEIIRYMRENKKEITVIDFEANMGGFNKYKEVLKRLEGEGTIYELPAGTWRLK